MNPFTFVQDYLKRATADSTANVLFKDVLGSKTDAATTSNTVTTTKSLMAYTKQLVNQSMLHNRCVAKTDGAVLLGADFLFEVTGGPVIATIVGVVTTVIGGASNGTLQHTTTTPSVTSSISTTVAIDTDAAGTTYRFVGATGVLTPVTNGAVIIDPVTVDDCKFLLPIGTVKFNCSAAQTGVIAWYMNYMPLSPLSVVTAAA